MCFRHSLQSGSREITHVNKKDNLIEIVDHDSTTMNLRMQLEPLYAHKFIVKMYLTHKFEHFTHISMREEMMYFKDGTRYQANHQFFWIQQHTQYIPPSGVWGG